MKGLVKIACGIDIFIIKYIQLRIYTHLVITLCVHPDL